MIDWSLAARIAGTVAGNPGRDVRLPGDLAALAALAARSEERVVSYTGLHPAAPLPLPEAVDREQWIGANLATMESTLAPLVDGMGAGLGRLAGPARAASGLLIAAEVGALTGYMAQRVMGQYELALLEPDVPPRLLFVAPNLQHAAVQLGAELDELLAWVAFHEITHAVQFGAVGWLHDHIAGLLRELLASLDVKFDPAALARMPGADDLRALVTRAREGGLFAVVAGPERRAIVDRLQATMAVVEGHAEHVMDAVGAGELPSLERLRAALNRRRRERPLLARVLERLIGLDLKLRQYEQGKRFCDAVVAKDGVAGLNRAFAAPELLPTLHELDDPVSWLVRTRAAA